jgi:conjugative transfer signal peptidase TraF
MRARRTALIVGTGLFLLSMAPVFVRGSPPFLLQLTASEPKGLYRLRPLPQPLTRGTLVTLRVPPHVAELVFTNGWLPRSWHGAEVFLVKPIAGLPGDTSCVDEQGVTVNGVWQGPVYRALGGVVLPALRGCWTLQPDQVLLLSTTTDRSFDGRYFGPVPRDALLREAVPVWTWED